MCVKNNSGNQKDNLETCLLCQSSTLLLRRSDILQGSFVEQPCLRACYKRLPRQDLGRQQAHGSSASWQRPVANRSLVPPSHGHRHPSCRDWQTFPQLAQTARQFRSLPLLELSKAQSEVVSSKLKRSY